MSRTFTKLFSSITESTVWCEPDRTRLVWIAMLAMADHAGRVFGSIPGLANRARVPIEDCEIAIETFLSPDKYSRTPDFDGRRIEPIDGGWRLLNHAKYRALKDEESAKESKRNYINTRRAKEREAANDAQVVENVEQSRSASTQAEADTEADTSKAKAKALAPPAKRGQRLPADWQPSGEDVAFAVELRVNWRRELDTFRDYWHAKPGQQAVKLDWSATWRNWIRKAQPTVGVKAAEPAKSQTFGGIEKLARTVYASPMAATGNSLGADEAPVLALAGTSGRGHRRNDVGDLD